MSNDAAALALAAIALQRANEAERKADLAERRAFVKGYQHDKATPEERHYYADSVYELWPVESDAPTTSDRIHAALISIFVLAVTAMGWFDVFNTDFPDGFPGVLVYLFITFVASLIIFGIGWVLDYIFNFEGSFVLIVVAAIIGGASYLAFYKPYQYDVQAETPSVYAPIQEIVGKGLFGCIYNKNFTEYNDFLNEVKKFAPDNEKVKSTCGLTFLGELKGWVKK